MTTLALLAAAVATAVVGVCEFTQVRALEYRVWRLERRRDQIERNVQRVGAAARARRTPRSILAAPGHLPEPAAPVRPVHHVGDLPAGTEAHGSNPGDANANEAGGAEDRDSLSDPAFEADSSGTQPAVHFAGGAR